MPEAAKKRILSEIEKNCHKFLRTAWEICKMFVGSLYEAHKMLTQSLQNVC